MVRGGFQGLSLLTLLRPNSRLHLSLILANSVSHGTVKDGVYTHSIGCIMGSDGSISPKRRDVTRAAQLSFGKSSTMPPLSPFTKSTREAFYLRRGSGRVPLDKHCQDRRFRDHHGQKTFRWAVTFLRIQSPPDRPSKFLNQSNIHLVLIKSVLWSPSCGSQPLPTYLAFIH